MEFHDAANIFPLDEESIDDLAADIGKYGLQIPIEVYEGKIIDGRRRWMACQKSGTKPIMKVVSPNDPIAYVLSLNLHRRHLSATQASMVGARADDLRGRLDEEAKERMKRKPANSAVEKLPPQNPGKTRDKIGELVGVSGKMIDYASKVLEKGTPEIIKAVDENRISVTNAAKIVDEPEEVQKEVAEKSKFSGGRYRTPTIKKENEEEGEPNGKTGVGVLRANEAINSLSRIPKNDQLRKRGFQIVTDWIKHNKD